MSCQALPGGAAGVAYAGWEIRRRPTRQWAMVSGVAGLVANLSLVLFYALTQPWRGVLQGLLLAGLISFDLQWPLVTAGIAVTFGWLLLVSRKGKRALPKSLVRLGTTVSLSYLTGALIVLAALLAPWGSVVQYVGFGLGGAVGLAGWLGFPLWPLMVRRIFEEEE